MSKIQTKRFQVGEIKSAILTCILENEEMTSEPAIRDYLKKNYNVSDHGTINKHLHSLLELGCIELTPPSKETTRANRWDIKTLKNLRNIKHEFPKIHLNDYEKSINIVLRELEHFEYIPNWLNCYIKLLLLPSFFNTSIETGGRELDNGIWKIYITSIGSYRHQRIDGLLRVCFFAYIKHHPGLKMSENEFTNTIKAHPWDIYRLFTEDVLLKWFNETFPGLPKEIPQLIFKTKLSGIEEIPEKIPEEIDDKDLVRYMLNAMRLRMEEMWDFELSSDDLLLEHFLHHDMLAGVDSPDELYFVNKTKENHALPKGPTEPWLTILKEAELADLKLASEMVFKYKQPSRFSFNTVDEIYKNVLEYYSRWSVQQ